MTKDTRVASLQRVADSAVTVFGTVGLMAFAALFAPIGLFLGGFFGVLGAIAIGSIVGFQAGRVVGSMVEMRFLALAELIRRTGSQHEAESASIDPGNE